MACEMHHRESYIEGQVTDYAKSLGWRQRKMAFVGRRGCPDRWYFRQGPAGLGQVVIIEFKDPNGRLSVAQKREVNWFRANGFEVHVIDNIQAGREVFDAHEGADAAAG